MKEITIKRRIKSAIIFAHKEGGGLYRHMRDKREQRSPFPPSIIWGYSLKGSVSRDFFSFNISLFEPIWATDKQLKVFSNSALDFAEIFDHKGISAVCNIPRI